MLLGAGWLAQGSLPFQPQPFLPSDHIELAVLVVDNNTTPNWRAGSKHSISLLVALSKLSQAEHTWSLARIQNVLQIFSSKWLRSWMTNQAKLHLAKEIRQLQTYLQLRGPLKHNFKGKNRGRERWAQIFLLLSATSCFFVTSWGDMETRRREKQKQEKCSFLTAASLLLKRAGLQRSRVPKAISSF